MEIFNAMDSIEAVDREGDAIETFATHDASKTRWMIMLSSCSQDAVKNGAIAN
jgi:hypothetical protein